MKAAEGQIRNGGELVSAQDEPGKGVKVLEEIVEDRCDFIVVELKPV